MRKISLPLIFLILVISCKSVKITENKTVESGFSIAQADTAAIPSFPAEVLYILAREYESAHDSLKPKFHTEKAKKIRKDSALTKEIYLEKRLIELYPETAYKGMISKMTKFYEDMIAEAEQEILNLPQKEFNITEKKEKLHAFVSDEDEMQFLKMTEAEINVYQKLNSLADDSAFFSFDQLNDTIADKKWHFEKRLNSDSIPFFLKEDLSIPMLVFGPGSYVFYRIMQSKARAVYAAEHYYPGQLNYGMLGDAFRHIFVNVMLKRYTTEEIAWLIMDIYWEKTGNNAPCDLMMDIHNNRVGRSTQYYSLIGESENWEEWGRNVKNFVQDTTQNAIYRNWDKEMPYFVIEEEENPLDDYLYIYITK
jgi:hypothetical protein